ncbi:MAG TPA: TadE/TadG family type IV pilus assembly protein [Acetobacteraceae bacterium]|jgi:Flp pilus assembly protein TadG
MSDRPAVRLRHDRRAITSVEFGIVAVAMLMCVFAIIEFGRALWAREALETAAAQGARCIGVLAGSCASGGAFSQQNAQSYIEGLAANWGITLTASNLTLTANAASGACSGMSSHVAQVNITYTFTTVVPNILPMLSNKSLTAQACFPMQS